MENNNKLFVDMSSENDNAAESAEVTEVHHHSHHSSHHSSSHHHHHHHSSGKHKRKKFSKSKAKKFLKRNKYKICNVVIAVLFAFVLICLGVLLDGKLSDDKSNTGATDFNYSAQNSSSSLIIEIPVFNGEVDIVNKAVAQYMNSDISVLASNVYKNNLHVANPDKGLPVTLWYDIKSMPVGYSVISADLFVSEKSDFSSPVVYSISEEETSVDVYNLKTGTQYYFRFVLSASNGAKTSVDGSFVTAKGPRMMNVDGVKNMRDFGGWETVDGKKIRQGILFRSTELDGAVESKYSITPDGVNTMLTVLGIKYDFDLRYKKDNPSGVDALGAGVEHQYYSAPMYSEVFKDGNKETVRKIFSDLSKSGKYPIVLHCTHGMDRAGTICFLLGAVLGVGEDDLMRDYQLSAFCHGEMWGMSKMNEFIGMLKSYNGATLKDKAENYLLSVEVTPAEIASIRAIFIEN